MTPKTSKPSPARRRRPAGGDPPDGLKAEIDMLRQAMRQLMQLADSDLELPELMRILDTLGKTGSRLAGLLKIEQQISGGDDDFAAELNRAIDDVLHELKGRPPGDG